jgi:hypothetical protein
MCRGLSQSPHTMRPSHRKARHAGWQIQKLYGYIANRVTPISLSCGTGVREGKTLFTVIVFPPAEHEWENIHEGQGLLEEVTGQEAKFRFNGAKPWTVFPDFNVGYDRKRKRPLMQFRERL